ncbi:hypothetical protein F3K20_21705 [Streptomyces scabiei]|nr:hypothetical protein [Streptomyces sp. LBUM 1477]MBP5884671.1 hypothetical protein [Streptomyces sp. LBUM 1487]MBP5900630.1 hypothetical protein [Streptomyces sp. LBUM 1488]QTU47097.1 hypothetical protein F3K20_21705 [Streptomyces sp. LBUM 1482]QTU63000.1 hypothetical protein F3K22_20070 [Streptomyces sp. LBUM 1475]
MGAPLRSRRSGRHSRTAPLPSRSLSAPAGGMSLSCGWLPRFRPQHERAAGRGQPGRRQEAGRAVEAARARAVRGS